MLLLAWLLTGVPHFDRGPGVLLNRAADYAVIFEGQVLAVEPQIPTFRTNLVLRADRYFRGAGSDTARAELGWIHTKEVATDINGRLLKVPGVGDRAIFWISRGSLDADGMFAKLSTDIQIWDITGDSLRSLGLSLEDGRQLISDMVRAGDPKSQLALAAAAVVGQAVGHPMKCPGLHEEGCVRFRVESWIKAVRPDTSITVMVPQNNLKRTYRHGLYLFAGPDSLGYFRPADPIWYYYPMADDDCIAGFRLEQAAPVDRLVPILLSRDELLRP